MPTSHAERRASPREGVDLAVRLTIGAESRSGRLTSVSRLGALVLVEEPATVGTPTELELLDGTGVRLRGQIVRVQVSGTAHALGILFGPLAPESRAFIESLMSGSK